MIFLPDTNAFSVHLRGRSPELSKRLTGHLRKSEVLLSVIVLSELEYGAQKAMKIGESRPASRVALLRQAVPFEPLTEDTVDFYAKLRVDLETKGEVIGGMDMLLAAHALALKATLVTRNVREFSRVPNLRVEDWQGDL